MIRKILIVDDSVLNRDILKGILKNDYEVLEAENGQVGLEIMLENHKKLSAVLLDIIMPVMDGLEMLEHIRGDVRLSQIPVIVTMSDSDEALRIKALRYGASDFLSKPYNAELILHCLKNNIALKETASFLNAVSTDRLTGLYNQDAFFDKAEDLIESHKSGHYILSSFNVENFRLVNDRYGRAVGDSVIKHIANCIRDNAAEVDGICCHISGDKFAMLFPAGNKNSKISDHYHNKAIRPDFIDWTLTIRVGRYTVTDLSLSISSMYDRAALAAASIKGKFDAYIANFDKTMHEQIVEEQQIVNDMRSALQNGEFEPWFQPQYNHATGALIGAEALVRWRKDGKIIPPYKFIPVFESNGFIYELDKNIWEQTCAHLRKWLDRGIEVPPVSVNISRRDILHPELFSYLVSIVKKYNLPLDLLRLEVTESAFSESAGEVVSLVNKLIDYGFTVEIDDFGSGYSSLNTLKDVPAQILKLDMKFFENTDNSKRGGNIVESVVRMAKWLGMTIIAEGVEEKEQADYLKSIGSHYIQGYLYAKPMPHADFEEVLFSSSKETQIAKLVTVKELDNNTFWDPKSMDTLIFNSYVGATCIFEYSNGKTELLRTNDRYAEALGCFAPEDGVFGTSRLPSYLSGRYLTLLHKTLKAAIKSHHEESCELQLVDPSDSAKREFVRITIRVIASNGEHYLFYCGIENLTNQREAERKERESAHRLSTIMDNMNAGVTALQVTDDGKSKFIFSNQHFFEMFGYGKDYVPSEEVEVFTRIYPQDMPLVISKARQIIKDRKPITVEFRGIKKDGTVINVRCFVSVTQLEGVDGTVVIINIFDITEEKELQEQLRFYSETSHDLLSVADTDKASIDALRNTKQYFAADYGYIIEFDDVRKTGSCTYEVCAEGIKPQKDKMQNFPIKDYDKWMQGLLKQGSICVPNLEALDDDTQGKLAMKEQGINSVLAVPIMNGEKLVGLIGLSNPSAHISMVKHLAAVGAHIEVVLNRRELTERLHNIEIDLLDNMPCGAALYEFDGKKLQLLHQNQRYWQLVGRRTRHEVSESMLEVLSPDERKAVAQEINDAIKESRIAEYDMHIPYGDGEYRLFHAIGTIVPKGDGKYLIYGIYTPVTEEAVAIKEMLPVAITAVMRSQEDYSFIKDKNYRYVSCSKAVYSLAGLDSEADIIGKTNHEIFTKQMADLYDVDEKAVMTSGQPIVNSLKAGISKDGTTNYQSMSIYPLNDSHGNVIGLFGMSRDVTSAREQQVQLEIMSSNVHSGLATFKVSPYEIRMLECNEDFFAHTEYTRKEFEELCKISPLTLVSEEDRDDVIKAVHGLLSNPGYVAERSYRAHRKSGGYSWVRAKGMVSEVIGDTMFVNVIQYDISDRKQEEESLRLLNWYDLTIEKMPGYVAIWEFADGDVLLREANKKYLEFMNTTEAEAYGKSIIYGFTPEEKQRVIDVLYEKQSKLENIEFTSRVCKANNAGECYMNVTATYLKKLNDHVIYYGTLADVTDLIETQKKLEKALKSSKK